MRLDFGNRAEQLEFVRQAVLGRETGTIVITGEPGMGRTNFLACAVSCADPARDEIVLLKSASEPPFAMSSRGPLPSALDSAPARDVTETRAGQRIGRRFVIAVDDVHRMDYSSLATLRNLARCGRALLLVTRPQASGSSAGLDPSSCLAHDRGVRTITLLPLGLPEVARALARVSAGPVPRSAAEAVRAATGGNPRFLGALVATTAAAEAPGMTYPGLAQLVAATREAWRQLALDRTEGLCRVALHCGARDDIAPIWAMLLLLRGRAHECLAFVESLDLAGKLPPELAIAHALALALGFGQVDEASRQLLASASNDGRPAELLLAFRAWVLAISGREATVTSALASLSRKDRATALFVHAARAMQAVLRGERGESVFHLRRAIASAEVSRDDYPWILPYLQAVLIDALMTCGRGKEAVSTARRFHAHEPSSGWEVAASMDALIANRALRPRLSPNSNIQSAPVYTTDISLRYQ